MRAWERAQAGPDPWREIHPAQEYKAPDLSKTPVEPQENLLQFIAQYNPYISEWKRDLLHMVHSHDLTIGEEDLPTEIKETEISVGEILSVARTLNEFISNG